MTSSDSVFRAKSIQLASILSLSAIWTSDLNYKSNNCLANSTASCRIYGSVNPKNTYPLETFAIVSQDSIFYILKSVY